MQRLSGLDAAFVYMETPTNHMHVGSIGVFDPSAMPGGYSFAKVRALVESRLTLVPPFRRRPPARCRSAAASGVDRGPRFRSRLSPPPSGAARLPAADGELAEFAADVFGRSLDRRHPLWEMYVVEGLAGRPCSRS